jgi:hypothetical protein
MSDKMTEILREISRAWVQNRLAEEPPEVWHRSHEAGRIADQTLGPRPMTVRCNDFGELARTLRLNRPFEPRRFGEHDR